MDLNGRTALVTGGGTGIGRGIALALARRGVSLVLVGRRPEPLASVRAEAGRNSWTIPIDLASPEARASLWQRAAEIAGTVPSLLIHSAAQFSGGALAVRRPEVVTETIAVNLVAPLELTRRAFPDLAANRGIVVFVGSMAGRPPLPAAALYSATKAGIRAAAVSLRPELEEAGIRSLLVYPPVTDTAMVRGMAGFDTSRRIADPEQIGERIVGVIASGRSGSLTLMTPAERLVAAAYHFAPSLVEAVLRRNADRFATGFQPADSAEGETPCP